MTRDKKSFPATEVEIFDPAGEARSEQALAALRETAASEQQERDQGVFDLGIAIGVGRLAGMLKNFSAAAEIHAFEKANKSKYFKVVPITHPDGSFRPAENIDEFCRLAFGRGYKAMQDSKSLLQRLGEDLYEAAISLDLPRTQMRLLVSLPEDERLSVKEAIEAAGKDEVVTLIHSLANKLDEAHAEVGNLKGELAATEEISSEKTKRIEELTKANRRIQSATPDQVLIDLHAESTRITNDARGAVIGNLRQALLAVQQHHDTHGGNSTVFLAGLVGQLAKDLLELRLEFDLPEIDTDEHGWIGAQD